MQIKIDHRPDRTDQGQGGCVFVIRLFPETNEEMATMEWGIAVDMVPSKMERIAQGDKFHYAVIFAPKPHQQS